MRHHVLACLAGTIALSLAGAASGAAQRAYSYTILDSPIPVVSYRATLGVGFKAAPGTDDATARRTIAEIYDAGLTSLKAKLETP